MAAYQPDIPPHVAGIIRHLPPDLRRAVRGAIDALSRNPALGEPLRREQEGLWKYPAKRFRIVYSIDRRDRVVRIFAVGHRRGIYETVAAPLTPPVTARNCF